MKAIVYRRYGSPDILRLEEVPKPEVRDGDVLVRVHAAAVNPLDWHLLRGKPYIVRPTSGWRKPKRNIPGVDVAGVVEAVGRDVTQFKPGDEVFGEKTPGLRRVRLRAREALRPQARQPDPRAGGGPARRRGHGAPGAAREGRRPAGTEGPHQRRVGRGRDVRRPAREGTSEPR